MFLEIARRCAWPGRAFSASSAGGAIWNEGQLRVEDSTFANNVGANGIGGAIANYGGTLTVNPLQH
jgi:hypothetical protein